MAQEKSRPQGPASDRPGLGAAGQDPDDSGLAGEAADNEGFHAGPPDSADPADRAEPQRGGAKEHGAKEHGAQEQGGATGGPEDPTAAEQDPTGDDDPDQNPPLPRTWN